MLDIFKKHSGPLILSVVFAVIGATFGFLVDADDQGIYLSVNFPDGRNAFTIGRPELSVQNFDFESLDESSAHQVSVKISKLKPQHLFSRQLWNMAQKGQGPFQSEQVTIKLIFTDQISGPIGAACRHSPILGKSIVAFDIDEPGEITIGTRGILGIQVLMPEEFSSECSHTPETSHAMWINRGLVESWLGKTLDDRPTLVVKAKLVLTNTTFTISPALANL